MRGFVFTLEMMYGVLVVAFFFTIVVSIIQPQETLSFSSLQIRAKDATMEWFFTGNYTNPLTPPNVEFACDLGFRPVVTTAMQDPLLTDNWSSKVNCVVRP